MRVSESSVRVGAILLALLSVSATNSEKLSTVFVLDTSDSDPGGNGEADTAPAQRSPEDQNTRIITDVSASSCERNCRELKQNQTSVHRPPTTTQAPTRPNNQQTDSQHRSIQSDEPQRNHDNGSSTRRLEDEAQLTPAVHRRPSNTSSNHSHSNTSSNHNHSNRDINHNSNQQHHNDQKHKHQKQTTTRLLTTVRPHGGETSAEGGAPKTEERLLISITSEDDESYPKPVKNPNSGQSHDEPDSIQLPSSSSSQSPHHRKPSITISIQDASINKQNGGSGPAAVIVRPGEDGQSIVIATVGASSSNSNKYKPALNDNINVMQQQNSNLNQHLNSNQNMQQPYREPINNPIQSIIQHHQTITTSSTTRRPALVNNDYSQNQRPIASSTLVEPQLPNQALDERPQRPLSVTGTSSDSEPNASSAYNQTPRPAGAALEQRPTSEPYSGTTYNENDHNNAGFSPASSNFDQYQANTNGNNNEPRFPLNEKNCGVMHETRIVGGDEADPDDFMWMTAIIKSKPKDGEPRPFCGGSLITRRHILTAAHCLEGLAPRDVLVRLGSYDFEDSASSSSADYAIDQFRVPAQYSKKTHVADIAIMRLKTPLSPNENYKTVCMPQPRRSYVGALGTVTGYGSQSQTFRRAAPKLRQVTVPIWENRKCSAVYKKNLTDSFLCAGYEEGGKDACQGDSGGPLMTEGPDQKMMIVGVVSHGIGCGSPGYPGVYTRTTTFADWIEKNTRE